ncbi:stalk domain-containing protein [Paenibacillus sp. y28]|uniref:stalk domain-containing protein n=1 Tax=Paenibacillus sp. y28 TaxID=3129110 RepID=UPI00301B3876
MKARKWHKAALLSMIIGSSFAAGAVAADTEILQRVEAYLRPDYVVKLDGVKVDLSTTAPLIYEGSSYLPLKKIGELLGANVNWDAASKTINLTHSVYVKNPINPEYENTVETFTMEYPEVMKVKYLGKEYPLVVDKNYNKNTDYYRLSDLQKMGLDTDGLKKAKEKITGWLYVRKEEADSLWKQKPVMENAYETLVTGETDEYKLEALNDFSPEAASYEKGSTKKVKFLKGTAIVIDASDKPNEYDVLMLHHKYFSYHVKLESYWEDKIIDGAIRRVTMWRIVEYTSKDLQPLCDDLSSCSYNLEEEDA